MKIMKYATGAEQSKRELGTYTYKPTMSSNKGGTRYEPEYIHDQHRVGICTSISLTTLAHKVTGKRYSPDFQYLLQKKFQDGNWNEGSSSFSACRTAHRFGLLPEKLFEKYITEDDRKLTYRQYVKKLQDISDDEINKLLEKTEKVVEGYAYVPPQEEFLKAAINENKGGLLVRFAIGNEWWRKPILPLRKPKEVISGHLVVHSDYDGDKLWIANSWGTDWAENGSGYSEFSQYRPTEAFAVFFQELPKEVNKKWTINQVIRVLKTLKKLGITK